MTLRNMKSVPAEELARRLETVRELRVSATEGYEIVRDKDTGEHYLKYSYAHIPVAEGQTEREEYHHLMPVTNDEVLAYVLGEQEYAYPEHWRRTYLRNGPEGRYVWFAPADEDEYAAYEQLGKQISQRLLEFKKHGKYDEESVRQLLERLEKEFDV